MRVLALGVVALALVVWLGFGSPQSQVAKPPSLVVVSTDGLAAKSTVWIYDGDGLTRLGEVNHRVGAGVRAVTAPERGVVLVSADVSEDRSYGASLFRVEAGRAPQLLVDRLAHASRPLVAGDAIWVSRGVAGPALDGVRRVDALSVDSVGFDGVAHTRFETAGWELHLGATTGADVLVYLKGAAGAQLLTVSTDGSTHRLLPVGGLSQSARDFTVDGRGRVVFADLDGSGWAVLRLESGNKERLLSSASDHLAPFAWRDDVAFSQLDSDGDVGLATLGRGALGPVGRGVDVVRAVSSDGNWVALWHYRAGLVEPDVVLMPATGGRARVLTPPAGTRFEIAGFWR